MKILKQTTTQLITQHRQKGARLAIACSLLLGVVSMLIATITPEISCRRGGALAQCKVIRHMLGNWQIEHPIVIQGIRSESICGFQRGKPGGSCSSSSFVLVVETQSGEIWLVANSASPKIQRFMNDPTQTSLQIRSTAWLHLNQPVSNGFWFMFSLVMFIIACRYLVNQRTYRCEFDKMKNWVRVTQQYHLMHRTTEFSVSELKSICVCQKLGSGCIMLTLMSGQEVVIAESVWSRMAIEDHPLAGPVWVNKDLEKDMQVIVSFLRTEGLASSLNTD